MNDLLALLAYEGVGNGKASEYDPTQQFINWPPEGILSPNVDKSPVDIHEEIKESEGRGEPHDNLSA